MAGRKVIFGQKIKKHGLFLAMLCIGIACSLIIKTQEVEKNMAHITMYSTGTCPYCERARQLLAQKKLAYTEIRVDADPEKRKEMTQRSQRTSVPQIFINEHHIGGCDDLYALEAKGGLDTLLNSTAQN